MNINASPPTVYKCIQVRLYNDNYINTSKFT